MYLENDIQRVTTFLFFNYSISVLFADVEGVFISTIHSTFKGFNRRKSNLELIDYREKKNNINMKTKIRPEQML